MERINPYNERVATVVGGRGVLGSKLVSSLESLGFGKVLICEKGDPFLDYLNRSTDLVLAVDNIQVESLLLAGRDNLRPDHNITEGSSVKVPLIPLLRQIDEMGTSVAPFHLGARPDMSWMGLKAWICLVGPNSQRARNLAFDIFFSANSFISVIDIDEHKNIEKAQWVTMAASHMILDVLRRLGFSLSEFDHFATLNAELLTLPVGRTAGQGPGIPSEVLFNQPEKADFLESFRQGIEAFGHVLEDRDELKGFLQGNIDFHDNPAGFVKTLFDKAGIIGATNANLRMYKFSFRTTNDRPGELRRLLEPFEVEEANITAFQSKRAELKPEEREKGIDPDKVVEFYVGIDPRTVDDDKDRRIKERLTEMGCEVVDFNGF